MRKRHAAVALALAAVFSLPAVAEVRKQDKDFATQVGKLTKQKKTEKLKEVLREWIDSAPTDASVWGLLCHSAVDVKDNDLALAACEKSAALAKEEGFKADGVFAYYNVAMVQLQRKEYAKAKAACDEAAALDAEAGEAWVCVGESYSAPALEASLKAHNVSQEYYPTAEVKADAIKAIEAYERAIASESTGDKELAAAWWYNIGGLNFNVLSKYPAALEAFGKAAELNPHYPNIWYMMGITGALVHGKKGFEEARANAKRYSPEDTKALNAWLQEYLSARGMTE